MFNFPVMWQVNYRPMPSADEEDGHFRKRYKTSAQQQQQQQPQQQPQCNQDWNSRSIQFPIPAEHFNPLDEPSPLGLKLRKSPSLLDMIQMKLYGTNVSFVGNAPGENSKVEKKKDVRTSVASSSTNKLKPSKFVASFLRIGSWKFVSRREGDLMAKCYYSKQILVWEILDFGQKSKIEFQWSDIVSLNASCPDDSPGNLTIVLSKPPLFFRESNPQPRKHTLWQATADFTDGQASMHREHLLQCPEGVLNKHYEKLIQSDMRLKCLSQEAKTVMHAPFFISPACASEEGISRYHQANQLVTAKACPISSAALPFSASLNVEQMSPLGIAPLHLLEEAFSPSSGAIEANEICDVQGFPLLKNHDLSKFSGLRQSMSVNDLLNHMEHMTSRKTSECKDIMDNIADHLLNDTQTITACDEKYLMSRVNSLCSLLQDPVVDSNNKPDGETNINEHNKFEPESTCITTPVRMFEISTMGHENKDITDFTPCEQPNMPRTDSFGDLLFHLQRSGSLTNFLAKIVEDGDNHT